jgi:hypothetical protein
MSLDTPENRRTPRRNRRGHGGSVGGVLAHDRQKKQDDGTVLEDAKYCASVANAGLRVLAGQRCDARCKKSAAPRTGRP